MFLAPLTEAPFAIQVHVVAALIAVVIGPFVLFRRSRDRIHRWLGRIWLPMVVVVAVSGLFIKSEVAAFGWFGPIHLLSLYALWGVADGLWQIRLGRIDRHRATMQSLWFGGMGLAGIFTFVPGRTMNRLVFGGPSDLGWIVIGVALVVIVWGWRRWRLVPS